MPKISIIIPIFNVEKYLCKCVQSAINQTLKDIEIILVDDESPDGCPQMCDKYAIQDSRIKVVHKKNGGLGFARNSGLEIATGELVTFLDSDDLVDIQTYEHLYNIISSNDLDVVYYKYKKFSDGDTINKTSMKDDVTLYEKAEVKKLMLDLIATDIYDKSDHRIQCSSCTAVYRLDIIKRNNIRFHSERELISEDLIFNLDFLTNANRLAFHEGYYYYYRFNPDSLTSAVRTDRIEMNLILYKYVNTHLLDWKLDLSSGIERNRRLFIANSRTAIKSILKSAYQYKRKWLIENLAYPIWDELYHTYPWAKLPLYQKVFFYLCKTKLYTPLSILSKIV